MNEAARLAADLETFLADHAALPFSCPDEVRIEWAPVTGRAARSRRLQRRLVCAGCGAVFTGPPGVFVTHLLRLAWREGWETRYQQRRRHDYCKDCR